METSRIGVLWTSMGYSGSSTLYQRMHRNYSINYVITTGIQDEKSFIVPLLIVVKQVHPHDPMLERTEARTGGRGLGPERPHGPEQVDHQQHTPHILLHPLVVVLVQGAYLADVLGGDFVDYFEPRRLRDVLYAGLVHEVGDVVA